MAPRWMGCESLAKTVTFLCFAVVVLRCRILRSLASRLMCPSFPSNVLFGEARDFLSTGESGLRDSRVSAPCSAESRSVGTLFTSLLKQSCLYRWFLFAWASAVRLLSHTHLSIHHPSGCCLMCSYVVCLCACVRVCVFVRASSWRRLCH